MRNCSLCRVVSGEAVAVRLYEDELVLAVLHQLPLNPGHALLFPKAHYASITAVPELTQARLAAVSPPLAQSLTRAVDGDGFNMHLANGTCAGQEIQHTHWHLVPRLVADGFSWNWRAEAPLEAAAGAELGATVRSRLARASHLPGVTDEF